MKLEPVAETRGAGEAEAPIDVEGDVEEVYVTPKRLAHLGGDCLAGERERERERAVLAHAGSHAAVQDVVPMDGRAIFQW